MLKPFPTLCLFRWCKENTLSTAMWMLCATGVFRVFCACVVNFHVMNSLRKSSSPADFIWPNGIQKLYLVAPTCLLPIISINLFIPV